MFQTGWLGAIAFGVSPEVVRRVPGDPQDTSSPSTRPRIWKYGSLEVAFSGGELAFIGLYFRIDDLLPANLYFTGYCPVCGTTRQEFVEYLTAEGLPFGIFDLLTFDTQTCYEVGMGVHVLFDEHDRLDSVQYSRGAPRQGVTKSRRPW